MKGSNLFKRSSYLHLMHIFHLDRPLAAYRTQYACVDYRHVLFVK